MAAVPGVPQFCPSARELDDLELIASGALPGPLDLELPADVAEHATAAGSVELVDPEGLPLASLTWPDREVTALARPAYGPFRRLYLTPAEARAQHPDGFTAVLVGGIADRPAVLRAAVAESSAVVAIPIAANDPRTPRVLAAYGDPAVAPPVVLAGSDPSEQGVVVFFTGLSGSGKSTLARALMDRVLEAGERTVTSLDGDVVRRNLSAGLTFSKADRETNIRRIGWVAAEIARHGGVAVCSPIAPFDETRRQVRHYVDEAGGAFFLVHVATPLEECERRDRKGLYAKARAGEIPEFTGISSPYEVPQDADVVVDTTGRTIDDALADVLRGLERRGLDLGIGPTPQPTALVEQPEPLGEGVVETSRPLRVLFVCTANISRSPFMELTARRLAGENADIVFESAGTRGFTDREMDEAMVPLLAAGIDGAAFRSRPLTRQLLDEADLVLTAEASHRSFILDDFPGLFRKVFTLGQAAAAIERIGPDSLPREELLRRLAETRGSADNDVADPYRRGPEAAQRAADLITELLGVVVPALTRRS